MLVSHEDGATIPLEEGNYRGGLLALPRENVEDRFRDGR